MKPTGRLRLPKRLSRIESCSWFVPIVARCKVPELARLHKGHSAAALVTDASRQYHHGRRKEFPLPTTKEWGEGQGEERPNRVVTACTSPSPQPSPRSSLAGRGSNGARSGGTVEMRPLVTKPAAFGGQGVKGVKIASARLTGNFQIGRVPAH